MNKGFQQFLKHWFHSKPGLVVFQQEKRLIDAALENLFGYFAVQLGCVSKENLLENSRISGKVLVDQNNASVVSQLENVNWVRAELDFLPIGKDKADLVLLPHTLEIAEDPYYILRQVDTMLLPEGHIILTGFNPVGCLPFRMKNLSHSKEFKQAKLRRAARLTEWLEVLGYEVTSLKYTSVICFTANQKYPSWVKIIEKIEQWLCLIGIDFGNVYCLVAKKRVDSPTLVGLKWHLPRWQGLRGQSPSASQRNGSDNKPAIHSKTSK